MFPETFGFDDDTRITTLGEGVDRRDRCGKVADIESAFQIARERRLEEVDYQCLALLPDIDTRRAIGEIDDDSPFTVLPPSEIDVAQRMRALARARLGESLYRRRRIAARDGLVEQGH